ncbi:PREDICTED: uncharacterized protein LOC107347374 [Acropora digitifera]|uniref:uncharacterized protein LOC107347374 n=1 Tax=Acropora digitifera TaxID=70779 RepID=UPI00077AF172|nr:PREDICTED: uncharacterized protein LOC107347374 [Acropora digitifera]
MLVTKVLLVFILYDFKVTEANCQTRCEKASGRTTDTGLTNLALVGHSFKNFTVNKPFDCFVKCFHERCRCQAYQMKDGRNCELLDDDKFSVPYDLMEVQGYVYFDFNREYYKATINACVSQPCSNQCCHENPCFNGGTCTELCVHANRKFNCTCAIGYFGKLCEKKSPTSCKQLQIEAKKPRQSAVYTLYDPTSKSFYQTFCDFTSENGFVWTLLESFSLANRNDFKGQSFLIDYPVNQNSFEWNKFRLSLSIMNSTLSHSTHFRATCNFNTDGLVTRDYLRAKTADLNILQLKSSLCVKMEYINIRGYDCYNCTARMAQRINWHLHVDSYYTAKFCQFTSAGNGSIASPSGEDNFGQYYEINPLHRCSSANDATTQWWFGEQ